MQVSTKFTTGTCTTELNLSTLVDPSILEGAVSLHFDARARGTPSDVRDTYNIKVRVLGQEDQVSGGTTNSLTGSFQDFMLSIDLTSFTQSDLASATVTAFVSGKDIEYWGGWYGSKFRAMDVYIIKESVSVPVPSCFVKSQNG